MNILKISHGSNFFSLSDHHMMLKNNLVSVHPDTRAKGQSYETQYSHFINAARGDVFFICRSNESIDVIGMFVDKRPLYALLEGHYEEWVDREFITLFEAKNSTTYKKSGERWWLPGNNSTCAVVKSNEYLEFEKSILDPAFGITMGQLKAKRDLELQKLELSIKSILSVQQRFQAYYSNEQLIYDDINSLSKIERLKVYYEYDLKENIEKQPVVWLRREIIKSLVENDIQLSTLMINELKQKISTNFEKNVFHAWSSNFRVLYPLVYAKYKNDILDYGKKLAIKLQADLGLENDTKIKEVYLDGAQNQGYDRIWIAIYNKTHRTQKTAIQLFLEIYDGFKFGRVSKINPKIDEFTFENTFDYNAVLEKLRTYKEEILDDDINKFNSMIDLKEILEFKKQIILQGPPGTGKTYTAKDLAEFILTGKFNSCKKTQALTLKVSDQFELIQFHPAYTYEDFIRGIVTEPHGDKIQYNAKDKLFLELVDKAINDQDRKPYILIIDEINRANLSAVLGELIYALEYRNESFKSMYADKGGNFDITIPDNLYIIGTMNTADRSVGHLDYALRRRFAFYDVLPQVCVEANFEKELFEKVSTLFVKEIKTKVDELEASEHLSIEFQDRPQDIWLGHSYFFKDEDTDFSLRIQYEIIPILQEYLKDGILNNTDAVKTLIKEISNYTVTDANS
ncbi:AAA family ATPase [Myroides odoratimimus]|uniref:McrB family protein n=1 Tax=Myroides odoratimimus TaxID=76832 RepID=UPI00257503A5|nr:AAA family ATPase [Myroides odoratimimus]MDM1036257.1 AAA family ATPase [Myroides odoratimimus]